MLTVCKNGLSSRMCGILRRLIWQKMSCSMVNKWQIQILRRYKLWNWCVEGDNNEMKLRGIRFEDVNLIEVSLDSVPYSGYIPRLKSFFVRWIKFICYKPVEWIKCSLFPLLPGGRCGWASRPTVCIILLPGIYCVLQFIASWLGSLPSSHVAAKHDPFCHSHVV